MSDIIKISHLYKTFRSTTHGVQIIKALDDVSLDVREGEVLGILGPNGAGKTTLLNILSTLLLPDSGEIEILGIKSIPANFDRLRSLFNMSSGYPNYPWSLTVVENLRFYGRLYGVRGKELDQRIAKLVEMFDLGDFAHRRFDELSSGTKQRLSLAKALINNPRILFLDEPTVGLDPDVAAKTREIILKIIKELKVTALLTTHYMQEAEKMCERIAFIKQGQVLRLATPRELKNAHGKEDLEEVFIELARHRPAAHGPASERVSVAYAHKGAADIFQRDSFMKTASAWLNRCAAFSYRNFIFAIRNAFAFAELIFWPIVTLISIGLMGDYLQLQENALGFILTGAIAGGILQVAQLDVAYSLLYEVWSKSMKHTLLAPVGISEHLFGSWAIGMVRGTAVFIILGSAAVFLFDFKFPAPAVTAIFLMGMFCCSLLLGMLVSILILTFGQKAEITAWMFAYLFMLLCGIYYPVETLPSFFHALAQVIPITYFLEYFRGNLNPEWGTIETLLKGFGLVGVYLAAELSLLKYAFYQARKKGVIIRLSE